MARVSGDLREQEIQVLVRPLDDLLARGRWPHHGLSGLRERRFWGGLRPPPLNPIGGFKPPAPSCEGCEGYFLGLNSGSPEIWKNGRRVAWKGFVGLCPYPSFWVGGLVVWGTSPPPSQEFSCLVGVGNTKRCKWGATPWPEKEGGAVQQEPTNADLPVAQRHKQGVHIQGGRDEFASQTKIRSEIIRE